MFIQESFVPKDILTEILMRLPKEDRLTLRLTCRRFRDCADFLFWRESKANSADNFFKRMQKLPFRCRRLMLRNNRQYTFDVVEKIAHVLSLSDERRLEILLEEGYVVQEQRRRHYAYLRNSFVLDNAIIALYTELITREQAAELENEWGAIFCLFENDATLKALQDNIFDPLQFAKLLRGQQRVHLCSEGGLVALRESFITVEQAARITPEVLVVLFSKSSIAALREKLFTLNEIIVMTLDVLQSLLTEYGVAALREKLITLNEVTQLKDRMTLTSLFTAPGVQVLREKLMTIDQINALPQGHVYFLLSDWGLIVLRERLITLEQVARMSSAGMKWLFTQNGVAGLRESLIEVEQIINMTSPCLRYLLTNNGLKFLRAGRITSQKASNMNLNELEVFLSLKQSMRRKYK